MHGRGSSEGCGNFGCRGASIARACVRHRRARLLEDPTSHGRAVQGRRLPGCDGSRSAKALTINRYAGRALLLFFYCAARNGTPRSDPDREVACANGQLSGTIRHVSRWAGTLTNGLITRRSVRDARRARHHLWSTTVLRSVRAAGDTGVVHVKVVGLRTCCGQRAELTRRCPVGRLEGRVRPSPPCRPRRSERRSSRDPRAGERRCASCRTCRCSTRRSAH